MDLKKTFNRINNPKTTADYEECITESDLRACPEGRSLLLAIRRRQREDKRIERMAANLGCAAAQPANRFIAG